MSSLSPEAYVRAIEAQLLPDDGPLRQGAGRVGRAAAAVDEYVRGSGGESVDAEKRCELYGELFDACPGSPQRRAVSLACGFLPAPLSRGSDVAQGRRAEMRQLFERDLSRAQTITDPPERRAALEAHLTRSVPFGPLASSAKEAALCLLKECIRDGLLGEARRHLRTARYLGWAPNTTDSDILQALPAIFDEVVAHGDLDELRDGYAQLLEAERVTAATATDVRDLRPALKAQLRRFEEHLGLGTASARTPVEDWLAEAEAKISNIKAHHPGLHREAERLLCECRSGAGEAGAEQRDCLRRLLDYPWFTGARPGDALDLKAFSEADMGGVLEALAGVYGHEAAKFRNIPDALRTLAINQRERIALRNSGKTLEDAQSMPAFGIAFDGPPGNGKTSLAVRLARALRRPLCFVSCGGLKLSEDIVGISRGHAGPRPGLLTEELRKAGSFSPVFVLDELSRADYEVLNALVGPTDPSQNHAWTDQYFGVPFDLSQVIWVATTNDFDALPDALRQRFVLIRTDGFSRHEKATYSRQQLTRWSSAIAEFQDLSLTDSVLQGLLDRFPDPGLRLLFRDGLYAALLGACRIGLRGPHAITESDLARMDICDRVTPATFTLNGVGLGVEVVLSDLKRRVRGASTVSIPFTVIGQAWSLRADSQGVQLCPGDQARASRRRAVLHIVNRDGDRVLVGANPAGLEYHWSWNFHLAGGHLRDLLLPDGSLLATVHSTQGA